MIFDFLFACLKKTLMLWRLQQFYYYYYIFGCISASPCTEREAGVLAISRIIMPGKVCYFRLPWYIRYNIGESNRMRAPAFLFRRPIFHLIRLISIILRLIPGQLYLHEGALFWLLDISCSGHASQSQQLFNEWHFHSIRNFAFIINFTYIILISLSL